MEYAGIAHIEDGIIVDYPVIDLRQRFPYTSFPYPLGPDDLPEGYIMVVFSDRPYFDPQNQKLIELDPVLVADVWTQQWDIIELQFTEEELRNRAKVARQIAVENITVTTAAGNTFDGDEVSQGRMSRTIMVLSTGAALSLPWILADNSVIQVTKEELMEALLLSGQRQSELWVLE